MTRFKSTCVARTTVKLIVYCPDIFKWPPFKQWLENRDSLVFTWHRPGDEFSPWSDVMITYEQGEFMDESMPAELSEYLESLWEEHCKADTGLILLRNYVPSPEDLKSEV